MTGPQRPGPPEEPWYLAYRRPPPSQPPLDRPPVPAHRPAPAMHTAPPPRHPPQRPAPAAAVAEAPAPVRNTARNLLIGVTVVLFAVAGVLLVVLLGDLGGGGAELDVTAAQRGVRAVLLDPINGYGRDDVSAVRCNDGRNPVVRSGSGFTCTVTVDGAVRRVAVVFTDDAGTYEVDRPR